MLLAANVCFLCCRIACVSNRLSHRLRLERIFERVRATGVPKISYQESVEVVKNIPEERISQHMCEQREVFEFSSQDRSLLRLVDQMLDVTKISRQDQNWQRAVEQFLDDTRREPLFHVLLRGFVN